MTDSTKSRTRSPAYPYLDLERAIQRVQLFYAKETLQKAYAEDAVAHIEYAKGSSRGNRALASLLNFGLLDEDGSKEGRQVWLSELGKEIFVYNELKSPASKVAIRKAALTPEIHKQLWTEWSQQGERLPSDASMRGYLLKEKAFNPKVVDSFIQEFKNTLSYAGMINDGIIIPESGSDESIAENKIDANQRTRRQKQMQTGNLGQLEDNTIPLVGGSTAILSIPRPLSKENYKLLKNWLALMEPSLTQGSQSAGDESSDEE